MRGLSLKVLVIIVGYLSLMVLAYLAGSLVTKLKYSKIGKTVPSWCEDCRSVLLKKAPNSQLTIKGKILEVGTDGVYVELDDQERIWITLLESGYKVFKRVNDTTVVGEKSDIQPGKIFMFSGLGISEFTKGFIYSSEIVLL